MDTLPSAYQYELFGDYLKPYLVANQHRKYQHGDLFTYQGVQFKVACTVWWGYLWIPKGSIFLKSPSVLSILLKDTPCHKREPVIWHITMDSQRGCRGCRLRARRGGPHREEHHDLLPGSPDPHLAESAASPFDEPSGPASPRAADAPPQL